MTTTESLNWYDLPPGARDWLVPGEQWAIWLPRGELSPADMLNAHDVLNSWDQLAGRMMRAALFDDTEEPRVLWAQAKAVAAVAEALAVRLGVSRV